MFKKDLKKRLEKIFGFAKTTYDAPSEAFEQDTLFITVASSVARTGSGKATATVTGFLTVYSKKDSLPYGYFNKRIGQAQKENPELTKPLFFFDMDTDVANSPARLIDIAERRVSFKFQFSEQYDPEQGSLTEVNFCNEGV